MICKIVVKEPSSYKKRGDVDFCKLASTTEQKISDTNAFKNRGLPKIFCRQNDAMVIVRDVKNSCQGTFLTYASANWSLHILERQKMPQTHTQRE